MGEEEVGFFWGEGEEKEFGVDIYSAREGFFWEGKFPPPFDKYGMPQGLL